MNEASTFSPDSLEPGRPPAAHASERLAAEAAEGSRVLPIIEERATIRREVVETGRVRLTRLVHEAEEQVSVPVQHDEVQVERVPLNQTLPAGATAPGTRYEGDTLIIPVLREVAVVETRLLLVEELRVTKRQVTTQHTEPLALRREEINVEHLPPAVPRADAPA
jgi:uncharacterized protein (TIGR02271 family)